ncbi:hypothetical protein WOLCODRAFT_155679 [Wolfiporia cocos MD-104 SS10]|uniref:Uncharacterized protein n=1 Tax=Wolfiporia cocos (strain MD-104) TaxID=742152 RepID=A0A2H3IYI9_WOLCO|nr:hypothetical protein WOLCODRAFT_155679 [Wolfiporia cocos MD-104 SS10]
MPARSRGRTRRMTEYTYSTPTSSGTFQSCPSLSIVVPLARQPDHAVRCAALLLLFLHDVGRGGTARPTVAIQSLRLPSSGGATLVAVPRYRAACVAGTSPSPAHRSLARSLPFMRITSNQTAMPIAHRGVPQKPDRADLDPTFIRPCQRDRGWGGALTELACAPQYVSSVGLPRSRMIAHDRAPSLGRVHGPPPPRGARSYSGVACQRHPYANAHASWQIVQPAHPAASGRSPIVGRIASCHPHRTGAVKCPPTLFAHRSYCHSPGVISAATLAARMRRRAHPRPANANRSPHTSPHQSTAHASAEPPSLKAKVLESLWWLVWLPPPRGGSMRQVRASAGSRCRVRAAGVTSARVIDSRPYPAAARGSVTASARPRPFPAVPDPDDLRTGGDEREGGASRPEPEAPGAA